MPAIAVETDFPLWLVVLAALAGFAIARLSYRRTVPEVSGRRRIVLLTLRSVALTLLLLLIAKTSLHLTTTAIHAPSLAVLIDNSRSLTIQDHETARSTVLHSILNNDVFKRLESRAELSYYTFGKRLRSWKTTGGDTIALNEDATDIDGALRDLKRQTEGHPSNAVILISDGTYTTGKDPVYAAEELGSPLVTIGIGDSSAQKDLQIGGISANSLVYTGERAAVNVRVRSTGYEGERIEVTLSDGNRVLDRAPIVLEAGTRDYSIDLSYIPEHEGTVHLSAGVGSLPGEITGANNRRVFVARVLRNKTRILLMAGQPSSDVACIKQTLEEATTVAVRSFVENNRGGFYGPTPTSSDLDSADCIILAGYPSRTSQAALFQRVVERIVSARVPLLLFAEPALDYGKATALGESLPFTAVALSSSEQLVALQVAPDQQSSSIFGGAADAAAWAEMPPLFRTIGIYRAKAGAQIPGYVRADNMGTREPMLVLRSSGGVKAAALLGYGVWRLRLMTQGSQQTSSLFATFLINSLKWLTIPDDQRPVRVVPEDAEISRGDPVVLHGQTYSASGQPLENVGITITATRGENTYETVMRQIGEGRYEGRLESLPEGEYRYHASGALNGTAVGSDSGRFTVGAQDIEFQDTRANIQLMRQLAFRSGGLDVSPEQVPSLDSLLATIPSFQHYTIHTSTEADIWRSEWLFLAMMAALATEWIIRKAGGML